MNRSLVQGRSPVEDLDRRGHCDDEAHEGEDEACQQRLPADEHVVAPDQEADGRDRHARPRHELVAEHLLARKAGDELVDHAHAGQDHDVDRRMRVEPEQMLEQQGIAADFGIEDADAEHALDRDQHQGHRQHRRCQHQDDRSRIERPEEQRQPVPGQPRCAQPMDGDDEIEAGQDRGEAGDEHSSHGQDDIAVGIQRRERRVERPAGIDAAGQDREQRDRAAEHEQVPAQKVEPGKGEIARADHQRRDEIAERVGNRWNQEEPHHDDAVHGEQAIVHVGADEICLRSRELNPNRGCRRAADEEEENQAGEIQDRDTLVIGGEEPRAQAVAGVEIVVFVHGWCPPIDLM